MTTNGGMRTSYCVWSRFCKRLLGSSRWWGRDILCLLYPPVCVLCGRDLRERSLLCTGCSTGLQPLSGHRCACCGESLGDPSVDLCTACGTRERGFDTVIALGRYDEPWGQLVRAFKFDGERAVGRWLAARLARAAVWTALAETIDVVSFVPMTPAERRDRGFNQARVLARGVSRRLKRPMKKTLAKVRPTFPQSALSAARRRENLREAFRAIPSRGKHILLVDDICTTGSTAEACARELKRAGSASVSVLVVARA